MIVKFLRIRVLDERCTEVHVYEMWLLISAYTFKVEVIIMFFLVSENLLTNYEYLVTVPKLN
jgi:hypothetical protein